MKSGIKRKINLFDIVILVVLSILSLFLIALLFWGIITSLKTVDDALYYPVELPREGWQFSNYGYLLSHFNIMVSNLDGLTIRVRLPKILLNTFIYAGGGALIASFVPLIVAYCCVRFNSKKLSKVIYIVNLIVMMLPLVGTYPAQLKLSKQLGFYDTYYGMLIHQTIGFTGMYFLVYYAMIKGIDRSYYEAAYIDGAGEFCVFFQIYCPLLMNTFFTVTLLRFVGFWNDYNTPLLYMPGHPTLAYSIFRLSQSNDLEFSTLPMRMTAGVFMVFPIVTIFIIFKEKFVGNLTVGGVKG